MMTQLQSLLRRPLVALSSAALLLSLPPALAQSANFDSITLSTYPPTGASVTGRTVGVFALANIASRDQSGNLCAGFADTNPDHIITLQSDFPSLTVTVNSGEDTTLLIQGPDDNSVRCGQDISRANLDAQVSGNNWRAGTYRVWVGAHNQNQRFSYTLTVQE
ncbi:MAG TPA: hypothetical protein V6D02_15505 [Candidatus Obscuribacterales bacterium]